jgi:hypothetical protein
VAEKPILDPSVARRVFEQAAAPILEGLHEIPGTPPLFWRVTDHSFPILRVSVIVGASVRLVLVLDCQNYDYDPPSCWFEYPDGKRAPWPRIRDLAALYTGVVRGELRDNVNDIIAFNGGEGLICRRGQAGFHEAHPNENWRELRKENAGRLPFIIDAAVRVLDAGKLSHLPGPPAP